MLVTTLSEFDECLRILKNVSGPLVVDIEATGLHPFLRENPARMCGIALGSFDTDDHAFYLPYRHAEGANLPLETLEAVRELLSGVTWACHHGKYDAKVLAFDGFAAPKKLLDTMQLAHLCDENEESFGLKQLYVRHVNPEGAQEDAQLRELLRTRKLGKGDIWKLASHEVAPYALADVRMPRELHRKLYPELERWGLQELYAEACDFILVLLRMEQRGLMLDRAEVQRQMANITPRLQAINARIQELSPGININSPLQLREWLKLPKTAKEYLLAILEREPREDIKLVLEHRSLFKAESAFFLPFLGWTDEDDRVHTTFNHARTVTARLSSNDPNMQQCSRDQKGRAYSVRSCLVPSPGYFLVEGDYSAVEPRIAAHYSQDPVMLDAFLKGKDFHTTVAQSMFKKSNISKEERTDAKTLGLGVLYGMGAARAAGRLGLRHEKDENGEYIYHHELVWTFANEELVQVACSEVSREFCTCQGKAYITKFYEGLPELKPLKDLVTRKAQQNGYVRNPLSKRVRRFPGGRKAHKAFNSLIQQTAFEVMRRALVALDQRFSRTDEVRLLLTVHDSCVAEFRYCENADVNVRSFKRIMEETTKLSVPLLVDVKFGLSLSNTVKLDEKFD